MKKILYLSFAAVMLSVLSSCNNDNTEPIDSEPLVKSYQVLELSGHSPYAKTEYTPLYDDRGRVRKLVTETYTLKGNKQRLIKVEIRSFEYDDATHKAVVYSTNCWEILEERELYVMGPDTLTFSFDSDWKLQTITGGSATETYSYEGDYISSFSVEAYDLVTEYSWNGGDLASITQDDGMFPFIATFNYGTQTNPFVGVPDPVFAESFIPDYYCWGLNGRTSAHLPISMQDNFHGDITFSFDYKKDSSGRIIQVDILGDDTDSSYDKSIIINY
ncbi:MAG: hypothetical protein IJ154_09225 [Bacteroidales bacterium]|nr:hypothetical protein [Bacteroidales bacterium]